MMPVLKAIAAKSKTPVHFHGWLNNKSDTYRQLMAEATYFSLVSAKENASISLLEALASGCVVITSNTSGCPESVGDAGICIPPADPLALKAMLKQFIDNPELRDKHMQLGRTRAVTQFSWPAIADRYLALMKTAHETT